VRGPDASYVGFAVAPDVSATPRPKKYSSGRRESAAGYPPILFQIVGGGFTSPPGWIWVLVELVGSRGATETPRATAGGR